MKAARFTFVLLAVACASAEARAPTHIGPRYFLDNAAQYDGRPINTGGYLLWVSDRCVSLDTYGGRGLFAIGKGDADKIRKYHRETGDAYILIDGIFRAHFDPAGGVAPGACAEAGLERITVHASEP